MSFKFDPFIGNFVNASDSVDTSAFLKKDGSVPTTGNLVPDSALAHSLGTPALPFFQVNAYEMHIRDGANSIRGYLGLSGTTPVLNSTGNELRVATSNRTYKFTDSGFDINSSKMINLADPENPQDAATKAYVDSAGGGGVLGLTTPTIGEYLFAPDPDQGWAVFTLGDATYTSGLIQGTRAADGGDGWGGDIYIYGGFTPSPTGHPGDIVIDPGYRDDGSNYQGTTLILGRKIKIAGGFLQLPPMTTTERDAQALLDAPDYGAMIYNATTDKLQIYKFNAGSPAWVDVV